MFLDIETKIGHPRPDGLLLVGWALNAGPVRFDYQTPEFWSALAARDVVKVTQTKYDLRYLKLLGCDVGGDLHDTTVMAHLLNENTPLDIEWLAWRYSNVEMDKRLVRVSGAVYFRDDDDTRYDLEVYETWPPYVAGRFRAYCMRDVDTLRVLYTDLRQYLSESEWLAPFLDERVPYTNTLVNLETRGLPVNVAAVEALAEEYRPQKEQLGRELMEEASLPPSFNLNSGDQLCGYLFSRVLTLTDVLVYDKETIECLKSCLDGEHEDCDVHAPGVPYPTPLDVLDDMPIVEYVHVVDLLPEGFVLDKLGRDRVHGHWTVKGRGLKPTPPTRNKVTGELGKRPSTASPELLYAHAADPWVRKLCLEYRKLEKLLTTYLTKWPVEQHEGRLYGRFNQTGTVTGRLSSAGPNLQNVPSRGDRGKEVRGLFQGHLVVGDYDQLEMRLMAHFSQDANMMRIFREGKDPHLITAQGIFGSGIADDGEERGIGKTLNFAMGYGAGPKKVAQVLSLAGYATTKDTAAGYLAEMAHFYRGYFRWKEEVARRAKRTGTVATIGGTRRRLRANFKDTANWKLVAYGERQAVNAVIQGSAADIIRRAMVLYDASPISIMMPMLAQVHDEIVFELLGAYDGYQGPTVADALAMTKEMFETGHGFDLRVPLLFDPHYGDSWASAKAGADLELEELMA
jgi:DNA polymerase I-like protein with 3'-5' exonuclease and polymerase domains